MINLVVRLGHQSFVERKGGVYLRLGSGDLNISIVEIILLHVKLLVKTEILISSLLQESPLVFELLCDRVSQVTCGISSLSVLSNSQSVLVSQEIEG